MNNNPFETINERLSNIENLLLDLKHTPKESESESLSNDLLNIQQAAKFLNLSVPTVYTKVSQKELPFMKRSKRLYFSKQELIQYLKKGRRKTKEEIEAEAVNSLKKRKGQKL
jgi:excisionase family DNA binding protein